VSRLRHGIGNSREQVFVLATARFLRLIIHVYAIARTVPANLLCKNSCRREWRTVLTSCGTTVHMIRSSRIRIHPRQNICARRDAYVSHYVDASEYRRCNDLKCRFESRKRKNRNLTAIGRGNINGYPRAVLRFNPYN